MEQYAKFIDNNKIEVHANAEYPVTLNANGIKYELTPVGNVGEKHIVLPKGVNIGSCVNYTIQWPGTEKFNIDVEEFLKSDEVTKKYFNIDKISHRDLGVRCEPRKTTASIFAPYAKKVTLRYRYKDNKIERVILERGDKGIFSTIINKQLHGAIYTFEIIDYAGKKMRLADPFTRAAAKLGKGSIMISDEKFHKERDIKKIKSSESVIYKVDIDKFTSGNFSAILDGSVGNKLRGIDYLKSLGISHVEIANATLDSECHYSALNPKLIKSETSLKGIKEFTSVVSKLARNGIGTILSIRIDNEVSETKYMDITTPDIYINNHLNYELKVIREYIADSFVTLAKTYGVQGFRLTNTKAIPEKLISEITSAIKKVNKNIVVYVTDNMDENIKGLSQVNHEFKNILIGEGYDSYGIVTGNLADLGLLPYQINSDIDDLDGTELINYLEDRNEPLIARLKRLNTKEPREVHKLRVRLANMTLLLSKGIPIIEMGQEIGESASTFKWTKIDRARKEVIFTKQLITLRSMFHNVSGAKNEFELSSDKKLLTQNITGIKSSLGHEDIKVVYNFNPTEFIVDFGEIPYIEIFNETGIAEDQVISYDSVIPALSINMFVKVPTKNVKVRVAMDDSIHNANKANVKVNVLSAKTRAAREAAINIKVNKVEMPKTMANKQRRLTKKLGIKN